MATLIETDGDGDAVLTDLGLNTVEALLETDLGLVVARSRTTSTVRLGPQEDGKGIFLKRYTYPALRDLRKSLFRGVLFGAAKAKREWGNLGFLCRAGVNVPQRMAWGEERRRGFLRGCFLATGEVARAQSLEEVLGKPFESDILFQVGATAAAMHRAGYLDGTFVLRNLLAVSTGETWRIVKVDCPKGRTVRTVVLAQAAGDLAPLAAGLQVRQAGSGLDAVLQGYGNPPDGTAEAFRERILALSGVYRSKEIERLHDRGTALH